MDRQEDAVAQISGRNQLPGVVTRVVLGTVMAEVEIRVGEERVTAVITRASAERLGLKEGDQVRALIKSTDVMVLKDES